MKKADALAKGMTEEEFNEIDNDGNGDLSYEEYHTWLEKKKKERQIKAKMATAGGNVDGFGFDGESRIEGGVFGINY